MLQIRDPVREAALARAREAHQRKNEDAAATKAMARSEDVVPDAVDSIAAARKEAAAAGEAAIAASREAEEKWAAEKEQRKADLKASMARKVEEAAAAGQGQRSGAGGWAPLKVCSLLCACCTGLGGGAAVFVANSI